MEVWEQRGRNRGGEAVVGSQGRRDPMAGVGDDASCPCPRWGVGRVKEQHGGCTWEGMACAPVAARGDDGMESFRPQETPSGGPEQGGAGMGGAKAVEERSGGATVRAEAGWPHGWLGKAAAQVLPGQGRQGLEDGAPHDLGRAA